MALTPLDMWELGLIVVCLMLSCFFSGAETAITSLGSLKAKHLVDQGKAVRQLNLWLNHPGRVITTILIFNNVVNIFASALATDLASRFFEDQAIGIATGVMTFFVLVFGEVLPKSYAKANYEKIAIPVIQVIYTVYIAFFPLVYVLSNFANFVLKMQTGEENQAPPITEEELEFLVNVGQRAGILEETKQEMIAGIFDFDDTTVREIMTPRTDVTFLDSKATYEEALQVAIESGFSRIPVYDDEKGIDHVQGVLLVKDLLRIARDGNGSAANFTVMDHIREAYFAPESKLAIEMFKVLKKTKNHMAVVVDEHGGTAGLVTMEDIVEEIVGEIQDEYDTEEAEILELESGIWDVAGAANIDQFLEFFDLEEEDIEQDRGDVDTLAGWVTQLAGELPEVGKTVRLGPFKIEVTEVERQRIQRVRVSRVVADEAPSDAQPEA